MGLTALIGLLGAGGSHRYLGKEKTLEKKRTLKLKHCYMQLYVVTAAWLFQEYVDYRE